MSKYNVGGLVPFDVFMSNPPDLVIANDKVQEMTNLLKRLLNKSQERREFVGTRNLTIVYMDGEYRVAQYGQWDGYPEGQGITCLHFLRDKMDEPAFRAALSKIKWIDPDRLSAMWTDYGADKDTGMISMDKADRFRTRYPEFSRDIGAEILEMIQDGCLTTNCLQDDLTFAADSLWCEWAWLIDMDARKFEAYKGFNKEPLTEDDRFYFLRDHEDTDYHGYHGVKLCASWSLDSLPTDEQFLATFENEE